MQCSAVPIKAQSRWKWPQRKCKLRENAPQTHVKCIPLCIKNERQMYVTGMQKCTANMQFLLWMGSQSQNVQFTLIWVFSISLYKQLLTGWLGERWKCPCHVTSFLFVFCITNYTEGSKAGFRVTGGCEKLISIGIFFFFFFNIRFSVWKAARSAFLYHKNTAKRKWSSLVARSHAKRHSCCFIEHRKLAAWHWCQSETLCISSMNAKHSLVGQGGDCDVTPLHLHLVSWRSGPPTKTSPSSACTLSPGGLEELRNTLVRLKWYSYICQSIFLPRGMFMRKAVFTHCAVTDTWPDTAWKQRKQLFPVCPIHTAPQPGVCAAACCYKMQTCCSILSQCTVQNRMALCSSVAYCSDMHEMYILYTSKKVFLKQKKWAVWCAESRTAVPPTAVRRSRQLPDR